MQLIYEMQNSDEKAEVKTKQTICHSTECPSAPAMMTISILPALLLRWAICYRETSNLSYFAAYDQLWSN